VLVEIAGQPQSDALVAGLAARCASCVAALDPAASAGALGLLTSCGARRNPRRWGGLDADRTCRSVDWYLRLGHLPLCSLHRLASSGLSLWSHRAKDPGQDTTAGLLSVDVGQAANDVCNRVSRARMQA